jgi:hypothetical protein
VDADAVLGEQYELVAPHLTEEQRRLLAGAAARVLAAAAARSPLTAGLIARIQFVSQEHMTVVTSLASWRSKKSRQAGRRRPRSAGELRNELRVSASPAAPATGPGPLLRSPNDSLCRCLMNHTVCLPW